MDKALEKAISFEIGHDLPAEASEYATVDYLGIEHARDFSGIGICGAVRIVNAVGCENVRMAEFLELKQLESLMVRLSDLRDLVGGERLSRLMNLEVKNNRIEDLRPLIHCRRLQSLDVTGNPLSSVSYEEVIPALAERGVRVTFSDETEWKLTLRLHEAGLRFSFYRAHDGYRLCRPGLEYTQRPEARHPLVEPQELERAIETGPTAVEALFDDEGRMPKTLAP
jgi:hypothetical protein